MNKKFIAAAMAGTMALSLAACGGSSASTGESTAASTSTDTAASSAAETSAASGSMSVAWWGNQTRNERTQQVLDMKPPKKTPLLSKLCWSRNRPAIS